VRENGFHTAEWECPNPACGNHFVKFEKNRIKVSIGAARRTICGIQEV